MTVIAKLADGRVLAKVTTAGPSSYSAGGFDVTVPDVKKVEDVIFVGNNGGYLCEVADITKNTVKVKVYQFDYPATTAGPAVEASGDLSGVTFTLIVIGY